MKSTPLSAVITTFNSAATLGRCLDSVAFADEVLVADSGSTDATLALCSAAGARVVQIPFATYRQKKRDAIAAATHPWVLLLDSDEWLQPEASGAIRTWLSSASDKHGARLPRIERIFWRYAAAATRHNTFLRLFRRDLMQMSNCSVHAAPTVPGSVATLKSACIVHEGEPSVAVKVDKINQYSTGLASDRLHKARWVRTRMLLDPPWTFLKSYLLRRQCLNGWAGFINSVTLAFYAFLRHAKVHEARCKAAQDQRPHRAP